MLRFVPDVDALRAGGVPVAGGIGAASGDGVPTRSAPPPAPR
ncbi:hypothetical protein [Actinomadura bangladeshensis]|nr:hypothetical protein [Actinomadura bangladeshensis]